MPLFGNGGEILNKLPIVTIAVVEVDAGRYENIRAHRYADAAEDKPEAVIALDERWVLSTLRSAGPSVDDISYGSWSNHHGLDSYIKDLKQYE